MERKKEIMKRIINLILSVGLLIGILGGCVRYENGKPVDQKEEPKTEHKGEKVTGPKEEKKEPQVDQQATADLKNYLDENFSETTWYSLIQGIEVKDNRVNITTNVSKYENGKEQTENIDNAVWGYTNTNDSKYNFKEVNILDKDGKVILSEVNPLN